MLPGGDAAEAYALGIMVGILRYEGNAAGIFPEAESASVLSWSMGMEDTTGLVPSKGGDVAAAVLTLVPAFGKMPPPPMPKRG